MAICDICGKKIGFAENGSYLKVNGKMLELCEICTGKRNRLEHASRMGKYTENIEFELRKSADKNVDIDAVIDSIKHKNKPVSTVVKKELTQEELDREANRKQYLEQIQEYRKNRYKGMIYSLQGNRGRRMEVYYDKVIIHVDVTLGSVLTDNYTDGEKTIYYADCVGLQFKVPTMTIGYLQLETASGLMNNLKSNFFNENTFTYDVLTEEVREVYDFIQMRLDEIKKTK